MLDRLKKYIITNKIKGGLENHILSKQFVIHDITNEGKTIIYNKDFQTIIVNTNGEKEGRELGTVVFDIGGKVMFNIGFIPNSFTLFDFMIAEAIKSNQLNN